VLWNPVALSSDLPKLTVMPTACDGRDVALWRSATGRLSAWHDRCPHRGMRLSHGFVRGEMLNCIYHGWRFDNQAVCRKIPAHPEMEPPETITVPRFAVAETEGVIWVAEDGIDAPPPTLTPGLLPLRSIEVSRPADEIAHIGEAPVSGLTILVQSLPEGRAMLHVLTDPDMDPAQASRKLEHLRRELEDDVR